MATIISDLISHLQAGEAIAANDAIYIDSSDGKIYKFDATDDTQTFAGIAKEAGALDEFVKVVQSGRIKGFSGLTAGAFVYASTTTPGGFQITEPASSQKIILGIAKSATELVINGGLGIKPGGDGGAGEFNYFVDDSVSAEGGIGEWVVYRNTDTANQLGSVYAPDDFGGSTASAPITWTSNATDPLLGESDFKLTKSATTARGWGVYYPFTAEKAHLTLKLLFEAFADLSEFDDDDLSIFLVSSSDSFTSDFNVISANNPSVLVNKLITKQFQMDASDLEYRLCIHVQTNDALAKDAYFDDFKFGPRAVAGGAVVTDWKEYTPTLSWVSGVTGLVGKYRRVGDMLEGTVYFETTGTVTAANLNFTIPSGLTIDASKLPDGDGGTDWHILGDAVYRDVSDVGFTGNTLYLNSTSIYCRYIFNSDGASRGTYGASVSNTNPFTPASGDTFSMNYRVPIQGWSSNAQTSEDLGSREIVTALNKTSSQNIADFTLTTITFSSSDVERDTAAAFNDANDSIEILETGYYNLYTQVEFANNSTSFREVDFVFNGSFNKYTVRLQATNGGSTFVESSPAAVYLEVGDYINVRARQNSGGSLDVLSAKFHVSKLASPQTMLETETVFAEYSTNSGQTLADSDTVIYEDLVKDTHNAYNTSTGVYTIPINGVYHINGSTFANSVQEFRQINIDIDGSRYYGNYKDDTTSSSEAGTANISYTTYLEKGQQVEISSSSSGSITLSTNSSYNRFSIVRIK